MAHALFKACSEGNLAALHDLLHDVNPYELEVQGADPAHGSPEQYTTEQVILDLLAQAKNKLLPNGVPTTEPTYPHDGNDNSQKAYYPPPPPEAYPYYPTINPSLSTIPDGGAFYPPPPPPQAMGESHSPGGMNNLPPPEIARFIPCRYFPACRYGPSCMFAHPPQGYYPNGAPPQAQYPPFDHMNTPPYPPNYYPPPNFQQPNGPHPMAPLSPPPGPPHMMHARSSSEVVSPTQGPFSPNGVPPPVPYGPMSPSAYPHAAPMPVPLSIPPLPPVHHQSQVPPPGPQSPNFTPSPATPFNLQQDGSGIYPPQPPQQPPLPNGNVSFPPEADSAPNPQQSGPEGFNNGVPPPHREGPAHARRGGRHLSFNKPRPACLFFPAGRCKNGDDCRFPHVMPDNAAPTHQSPYFAGRGGGPRHPRGHAHLNGTSNGGLEEKFNNMNIRDESQTPHQQPQPNGQNGVETSIKPLNGTDEVGQVNANGNGIGVANRPRFPHGGKHHHPHHGYNHLNHYNGKAQKPPVQAFSKQRVPSADDFPVLAGTITPPAKSPLHATGPTAAQVLQAPPPYKKENVIVVNGTGKEPSSTRGTTPEHPRSPATSTKDVKADEPDGAVNQSAPSEPPVNKLPISFAAVATAAAVGPAPSTAGADISKEVSVSA
ncbi:hypothetical protein D9756_006030 [Leucocoprinus leucothites]|uniref:C3H1-type domain-containing protein n=1 Tax=Leucocoprinus leucothites TaxID=201217 RepID=A0A8H5FX59_9AGAR|nr:hypothetical protein D9756_006030 [Leucoagaricus leucothites]